MVANVSLLVSALNRTDIWHGICQLSERSVLGSLEFSIQALVDEFSYTCYTYGIPSESEEAVAEAALPYLEAMQRRELAMNPRWLFPEWVFDCSLDGEDDIPF